MAALGQGSFECLGSQFPVSAIRYPPVGISPNRPGADQRVATGLPGLEPLRSAPWSEEAPEAQLKSSQIVDPIVTKPQSGAIH